MVIIYKFRHCLSLIFLLFCHFVLLLILNSFSRYLIQNNEQIGWQNRIFSTFGLVFIFNKQTWFPDNTCFIGTHTHTRLTVFCPGLPGWFGTRKVKPIWILLKQETVSGSGISWAVCKSASRSRQITVPAPHRSVFFYILDALPAAQPTVSKHWRQHVS